MLRYGSLELREVLTMAPPVYTLESKFLVLANGAAVLRKKGLGNNVEGH